MANPDTESRDPFAQQSIAELVRQAAEQTATLSRQELRLAQLELTEKGKAAGVGAGLLGGAGIFALLAFAAALSALGAAFALVLPVWAAALVIAGVLVVLSGFTALVGRTRMKRGTPPTPDLAVHNVQRDVETIKESARR